MRAFDRLIDALRTRGELWEAAPGLIGLRGEALARMRDLDRRLHDICAAETADEWSVPQALPLNVLERAEYFASFPQWLTLASHLTDDPASLERIATSASPARAASEQCEPATTALPPAVCYHVYTALADSVVGSRRLITAQGCCWRHEGERFAPLRRGWAFTMREIVCVGTELECSNFCERGVVLARSLAAELGIDGELVQAEDPFFAPTGRGRALLQRLKGLKRELRLTIGDAETVAAASFNHHERFFGDAFDIRLSDGTPAHTACVAFGLERWLLAALIASGRPELQEAFA